MAQNLPLYRGRIISPLGNGGTLDESDGALLVNAEGRIEYAGPYAACPTGDNIVEHRSPDALILPGLVDTHVHAPQYPLRAQWSGELLNWLEKVVFPFEARFSDVELARRVARDFFAAALKQGTTTMAVFSTVHAEATSICFDEAFKSGIRALIGKSMIDMCAPPDLTHSAKQNMADMEALARQWHNKDNGRLQYCVTPRYAGSCSQQLLRDCGDFARVNNLPVQSHLAENTAELEFVHRQHSYSSGYTDIYARAGLLGERTIMAHAIYVPEADLDVLADSDTALAHCPCSNRFLQSGVMGLRKYQERGLRIGLGSDVAGGWTLSMFNEMREAIEGAKTWNFMHPKHERPAPTAVEALRLATLDGARALGLDGTIGSLEPGKEADFLLCSAPKEASRREGVDSTEKKLSELVYSTASPIIQAAYIRGACVFLHSAL